MLQNLLQNKYWKRGLLSFTAFGLLQMIGPHVIHAAEEAPDLAAQLADMKIAADTGWTMIAGFLVFWMNAGFGLVESAFCRSKNAVNILAKNFIVFALSLLAFWVIGFGLMFGNGSGFIGSEGMLLLGGLDNSPATGDAYKGAYSSIAWTGVPLFAKFFFQCVFAGTAATIVSGAVAERIKFLSFCIFSVFLVGVLYPITGHWIWGGGWLASYGGTGFWDFAGSTVVHSVGGWAALTGVLVLGPRLGKYEKDGKINAIPGHNMTSAFLGGLILWLGWFGFNPGSTMALVPGDIALISLTTAIAACAGTVTSAITATIVGGKPDFGMIVNGCLAGLVAITAPCYWVTPGSAFFIGAIAGVLVVLAVMMFDKLHIDDPVGAISVHLVNGIFGTLCVGLFAENVGGNAEATGLLVGGGANLLVAQIVGVLAVGAFTFITTLVIWLILKYTMGIRVSAEEEIEGLDYGEHGNVAYPDFTRAV